NMKAPLCVATLENAYTTHPGMKGCICHSDRGTQYTSDLYREAINKHGIIQSMNSDGGRWHDNARCESMWARMKDELFYTRDIKSTNYTVAELKVMIWDASSVTGIIEGYVPQTKDFLLWLKNNVTMRP
ncbi:Integrase core domain-containing protein, partial [Acetitomaculum ruminis DSM 5522]